MATWDLVPKIRSNVEYVGPSNEEEMICTGKWGKKNTLKRGRMGMGAGRVSLVSKGNREQRGIR